MKLIAQRRGTRFILKHSDHTEDVQVSQSGRTTCVRKRVSKRARKLNRKRDRDHLQ